MKTDAIESIIWQWKKHEDKHGNDSQATQALFFTARAELTRITTLAGLVQKPDGNDGVLVEALGDLMNLSRSSKIVRDNETGESVLQCVFCHQKLHYDGKHYCEYNYEFCEGRKYRQALAEARRVMEDDDD